MRDLLFPLLKISNLDPIWRTRSKFLGGVRFGGQGWGDNSTQIINIGRVGDKCFIEFLKNGGGGG